MSKRVMLVNPGTDPRFAVQEPLQLGFLASHLAKHGVEVRIADQLAGQPIEEEIGTWQPDLVGITATTPLANDAYRIAAYCRAMGIRTVMGGVHASVLPEEALQHVDVVVQGEGEAALLQIVRDDIAQGVVTAPYIPSIDDIPPPSRHLMQMDFYCRTTERTPGTYLHFVPPGKRVAALLTSRGCPYRCIFCHNTWRDAPYRFNSARRVVEEIEDVARTYGVECIFFIEDNFFAHKPRLREICELLGQKQLSVTWGCNARVNDVDRELLELVKSVGCRQVTFGFESGSQRILDVLKKGTTVEANRRAVELCNAVGLIPQGTIMIGNPTETVADIRSTQRFIRESDIESVGVCIATPYPGTELYEIMDREGLILSKDWSRYVMFDDQLPVWRTRYFGPADLVRLHGKVIRGFYFTPRFIARNFRDPRHALYLTRAGLEYFWTRLVQRIKG